MYQRCSVECKKKEYFNFDFFNLVFTLKLSNSTRSSGGEVSENNCAVPTRPIATDRRNDCTAQYNILMQTI